MSSLSMTASNAPPAAAIVAMTTVLNVFRTWDTPPAGDNPRRILIDCQYFPVDTGRIRPEYHAVPDLSRPRGRAAMRRAAVDAVVACVVASVCFTPAPLHA